MEADSAPVAELENYEEVLASAEGLGFFSSLWSHKRWTPTSKEVLHASERRVLKGLRTAYQQRQVPVGEHEINTLILGKGPPLVLVHGFGGGLAVWIANLDDLAEHFTVYAIDLLGFGRSSRPSFKGITADEGEDFFISSLREWADSLSLKKFNLLGHSMGGFLSTLFAIRWPERVERLILADPWGVPAKPPSFTESYSLKWRAIRGLASILKSPFALLRAAGPLGQGLLRRIRPDLGDKFKEHLGSPDAFHSYVYHCNVQEPSGEHAFHACTIPGAWASSPLCERLHLLPADVPLFCIYGADTWMDYPTMRRLQHTLPRPIEILLIPEAGHHVYVDNFIDFNRAIISIGRKGTLKPLLTELHHYQNYDQDFLGR